MIHNISKIKEDDRVDRMAGLHGTRFAEYLNEPVQLILGRLNEIME